MRKFVEYLVVISTKSSSLLRQQYAPVFKELNQASVTRRGETHEYHLAQMLVDMQEGNKESSKDENSEESKDESRDIDLMATMMRRKRKKSNQRTKKIAPFWMTK